MDSVAALLDGPRARGAFLLRSTMNPPWSLRIEDEAPLTLIAIVRGQAFITTDHAPGITSANPTHTPSGRPTRLGPGDVAIVLGPDPYTVADSPQTRPQVIIRPGQVCLSADGEVIKPMNDFGVRNWGNDVDGETVMVTGTYQLRSEVSRRLLAALPNLVVVREASWQNPLVGYLAEEIVKDEPGQEAVLDRLLDLLLIAVLRAWFARPEAQAPGWYRAHGDPIVGPALRLMHSDPARPWTVGMLATATGISRAALARRFNELVGEPPMTFLTTWRLTLAADLLHEPGSTIGSVAHQVGYGSAFALSTAFKRVRGISPQEYRARA